MSIVYNGSITTTITTFRAGCFDPTLNYAYVVESTNSRWYAYNLALNTLVATGLVLTNPSGMCMINAASAVVCYNNNTNTGTFVEVTTGYSQTVTGGTPANTTNSSGQYIAADMASGIAFSCTSTGRLIKKYTASPQALSTITLAAPANWVPRCIILKSTGRWLVGGSFGRVYEIDSNGNILDELLVPYNPNTGILTGYQGTGTPLDPGFICSMAMDGNNLLVVMGSYLLLFDYSTKTKLWQQSMASQSANDSILLSNAVSGVCYAGYNATTVDNNTIKEIDFTTGGIQIRDNPLFTGSINAIVAVAAHPTLNSAFALQSVANGIINMGIFPRYTTTRVVNVNPGGIHQKFRLWILDDSANPGVGPCQRYLDTYTQSPATIRVPYGKTFLEFVKVGEGDAALWDYSEYTT